MEDKKNKKHKKISSMADLLAAYENKFRLLKKGDRIEGTIKKLSKNEILLDIGAKADAKVIEYDPGNLSNILSLFSVGDRVSATVISPESKDGFPVVSLRAELQKRIFEKFSEKFRKNETFEVSLLSPVRGGFLVGLDFGVTGFLPNSEIVSDASAGKRLLVRIIELDEKKQRVIVSEKAVSFVSDVGKIESLFKIGEKINFTVLNITKSGIFGFVEKDGIKAEAFIRGEETPGFGVENLHDIYKKNQNIEAKIIDINKEKAQVLLSLREEKEKTEEKFKTGQKVSGKVAKITKKGVTVSLPGSVYGLIEASRVLADKVYEVGEEVEAEVLGFDKKKGVFLLSPILRTKPIGYR